MDPQGLAIFLLIIRFAAVCLFVAVVLKQINQIRTTQTEYQGVRVAIFAITLVLLYGQIAPMILDVAVAQGELGLEKTPGFLSLGYLFNNAIKDVIIGGLLLFIHYRVIHKSQ